MIESVLESFKHDILFYWKSMGKPRDLLNFIFWFILVAMFTGKTKAAIIGAGLLIPVYVWKVIRTGDWKHRMRNKE
jgi:hypothetical protein